MFAHPSANRVASLIETSALTFYRVTLCIGVVFAVARCLSVCLSVTLVDCIHTAEAIVKLLSRPGSAIILTFDP